MTLLGLCFLGKPSFGLAISSLGGHAPVGVRSDDYIVTTIAIAFAIIVYSFYLIYENRKIKLNV